MILPYVRSVLLEIVPEVDGRIYPLELPDPTLPAIVLSQPAHKQEYSLDHYSRIQVSILTESTETEHGYDKAHRIASLILASLNNHSGSKDGYRVEISHIIDTEQIAEKLNAFAIHSDYGVTWTK